MRRIDQVRDICRSLARRGWKDLFSRQGLNLLASDLEAELERKLPIDRLQPGFADFCLTGTKAIEPGDPARSLLYHAFASPDVHPVSEGGTARPASYPTLEELDHIENYIYSRDPLDLDDHEGAIVCVFGYEYRPATSSAHGYHADFIYSRTGIARVGTKAPAWHGP